MIVRLDLPKQRAALPKRKAPYWHHAPLAGGRGGITLGWRSMARTWVVRLRRDGQELVGKVGDDTLDFKAAVQAALDYADQNPITRRGLPTVWMAVENHLTVLENRDSDRIARSRMTAHVKHQPWSSKPLNVIDGQTMREWVRKMPASLTNASIKRIGTDLKAALNHALQDHMDALPPGWMEKIKHGFKSALASRRDPAEPVEREWISEDDLVAIFAACGNDDADTRALLSVMASTGLRFSQIIRCRVGDLIHGEHPRLRVPSSRKGKVGSAKEPHLVRAISRATYNLLLDAAGNRPAKEGLLQRDGEEWDHNSWQPIWRRLVTRAGVRDVPPTALRDLAIMRMLRSGLNPVTVARLHDTSVAIIQRHYGSAITDVDALAERAALPSFATYQAA